MTKHLLYILMFIGLTTGALSAQETLPDTILLKEVQVADKYPQIPGIRKAEINPQIMMLHQASSLSDALVCLPGLQVRSMSPGSLATVYVRGAGASHTQLLWNDMPLNSPMTGQSDFSVMPLMFADQVSLLAGNNSLFSHISGIGGTVSIENKADWNRPRSASAQLSAGSFGLWSGGIMLSHGNSKIISRTRYFYKQAANDYPFRNYAVIPVEQSFQQNAALSSHNILQEVFMRQNKTSYSLSILAGLNEREIPSLMTNVSAVQHDEIQKDNNFKISGSVERNIKHGILFIRPGFSYADLNYHLIHNVSSGNIKAIDSRSIENSFSSHQGLRMDIKKITLRAGVNLSCYQVNINEKVRNTGFSKTRPEISIYTNAEHRLSEKLKLIYALKSEIIENRFLPLTPAIYFSYRPKGEKLPVFFASAGMNNKFPTLNDLYYIPGGNPNLKPEFSRSVEAGLEDCLFQIAGTCLDLSITLFHQQISDWIVWQPSAYGYWQPLNIREARSSGVTADLSWKKDFAHGSLSANAQYTYNQARSEDEGYKSGQTVYLPEHNLTSQWQFTYKKWALTTESQFMSDRKTALYNNTWSPELPAVWIQNFSVGKKVSIGKSAISLSLKLNNIFNTEWQQILWRPMPGRHFLVTLKFDL